MNKEIKFSTRFVAYLLDILLVYIVLGFLLNIRFINPNYDKYIKEYERYNEILGSENALNEDNLNDIKDCFYNLSKYSVSYNVATVVIILLYFGVFQKYNKGQTLGKKIMKIKVVDNDKKDVSLIRFIIREIPMQFIYIGSVLPLLLNSILVYFLNSTTYLYAYGTVVIIVSIINIVSLGLILFRKDKRGLHDILANTKVVEE